MNTSSSTKTWVWIIIIVIVAGLAYFYFLGDSTSGSSALISSQNNNAAVGTQVLGLLNQIQSLRIDSSIFSDPGYKTLRNYSVMIPPVNVGRPNPFAPLPGVSTNSAGVNNSAGAKTQ